jgi:LuxR family maltose regulon positive regulatory protein
VLCNNVKKILEEHFCCLTGYAVLYYWATSVRQQNYLVFVIVQKASSMPRYAYAQLRWSEQTQNYLLSIGDQIREQAFTSAWLEQIVSFAFHSRLGMHYTVRKQRVQRGSSYWYAYRRIHGQLVKRYLGRTADLTLARLEEIAQLLESEADSRLRSLQPEQKIVVPQSAPRVSSVQVVASPSPGAAFPLLLSKLSPPRLSPFLLDRSRLFTLLDAGRESPLTLLSAPAGFGKTTLVCQWMAARRAAPDFPPVAWVSLETSDNDPLRFWRYLIAACQSFQVDLQEVHNALASMTPQPPFLPSSLEPMLTALLNALARCPSGGILVLEDYHAISEHSIHETVFFFLDHLPPTLHVILITRSDPPFAQARLRASNDLYEIRTADLRFSREETTALLRQVLPFPLDAATIEHLHVQLEGWVAGLHLVKFAFQRIITPAQGEQRLPLFSGSNASLQEYFVTEVFDLQPEPVQQFLLQTSILTRLTASLCDAVTERHDSQEMLTSLERANLFLEPLDTTGQWYRYSTLFSEAMRNEARSRLGEVRWHLLSVRASCWYEMHGDLHAAIDATLYAQDYVRAAHLIARYLREHALPGGIREPHTVHRWLAQFPEMILEQYPVLCLNEATALLFLSASWLPDASTLRSVEKLLCNAEHCFHAEQNLSKLGELFAFRSLLAVRQGDLQAAIRHAQQALGWLELDQRIWRGLCLCIVAREWVEMGHLQQARAALLEALALCEAVGNDYFKRIAMIHLARVSFELGDTQQAGSLYRQVLAEAREGDPSYTLCNALSGLALLSYECNELESASAYVQEAIAVSQSRHLLYEEVHAILILARVQQAQGQVFVAQQQLAALLDRLPASFPRLAGEIQAAQARLALSIGDYMTVQRWATGRLPHPDRSQDIEEELLCVCWLRVQGKLEEASRQLEHLLIAAEQEEHTRRLLEIQIEMILVLAANKRKAEALQMLRELLTRAFEKNAMRLFLDAGEQMAILLRSLLPQMHEQAMQAYVRALLNAFPVHEHRGTQASLIEPLSPQELRVLRLLVQHRSNADIASALVVSVNTVRTQVQSIYNKLGVHTRSAASEIARELRLIS